MVLRNDFYCLLTNPFFVVCASFSTSGAYSWLVLMFKLCPMCIIAHLGLSIVWTVFELLIWSQFRGYDASDGLFVCYEVIMGE
jgi:hypothetical protein